MAVASLRRLLFDEAEEEQRWAKIALESFGPTRRLFLPRPGSMAPEDFDRSTTTASAPALDSGGAEE
eukprot:5394283-Alexandrium_andersonii.AAC.1